MASALATNAAAPSGRWQAPRRGHQRHQPLGPAERLAVRAAEGELLEQAGQGGQPVYARAALARALGGQEAAIHAVSASPQADSGSSTRTPDPSAAPAARSAGSLTATPSAWS